MGGAVVEYINGIETIKAFNQTTSSYGKYSKSVQGNNHAKTVFFKRTLWLYSAVMYTIPATMITVLPAGLYFYMSGSLSVEIFITCVLLSFGLVSPLIVAMKHTDGVASLHTTLTEVQNILEEPELNRPIDFKTIKHSKIAFNKVQFAYEEDLVLDDVSFETIPDGMTAIVGASGSGKSTIGKLIVNFWDAKSGFITIGDVDVKDIPLDQVNEMISYVSQDNFLFNMSILENIRIGKPNASEKDVIQAAQRASCHDFIVALDEGYHTNAGDAGDRLSGGEKQRIAIARALLKDSPVVILDEATAYTDPENEAVIKESINELVNGKTLIVIAHRLSTIKNADQIVVMDHGKVADIGPHDTLIKRCKIYQDSWKAHNGNQVIKMTEEVV